MFGGQLWSQCRSKGGGWAENMGGHIDGRLHQQGFSWLLEMMQV